MGIYDWSFQTKDLQNFLSSYFEKGILKDLRTKNCYFFGITALF